MGITQKHAVWHGQAEAPPQKGFRGLSIPSCSTSACGGALETGKTNALSHDTGWKRIISGWMKASPKYRDTGGLFWFSQRAYRFYNHFTGLRWCASVSCDRVNLVYSIDSMGRPLLPVPQMERKGIPR